MIKLFKNVEKFNMKNHNDSVVCVKSDNKNFKIGHIYEIIDGNNGLTILGDNNEKTDLLCTHEDGIYSFEGTDYLRFIMFNELIYTMKYSLKKEKK